MTGRVLIVDDQPSIAHFLTRALEDQGHDVRAADCGAAATAAFQEDVPDVVLLDLKLPDASGLDLLADFKRRSEETAVVMLTAFGDIETAVRAMKAGAADFLTKPVNLEQLRLIVDKALERQGLWRELRQHRDEQTRRLTSTVVLGDSPCIRDTFSIAERVARSDTTTVLIEGESGTGKQVIATFIHSASPRAARPFVELNCAAIPTELLESELFGHEKGAFTDAKTQKSGLLEVADGGTLFLDEIGEMPMSLQVKLLKVLESMTFRRVGGTQDIRTNVRILSATNRDLEARCRSGEFREDLYYRLRVVPILVPPLRDRGRDILLFAKHFLHEFSKQFGKRFRALSPQVEKQLLTYPWPGNIRELRNLFERTVLLEDSEVLETTHLRLDVRTPSIGETDVVDRVSALLREGRIDDAGVDFEGIVDEIESRIIRLACEYTEWNQSRTAEVLGLGRDKLRYRMKRHGIERTRRAA